MDQCVPPESVSASKKNEAMGGATASSGNSQPGISGSANPKSGMSTIYGVTPPPLSEQTPGAPPPSYDSIFGKVRQIQKDSESVGERICETCCSVVCCTLFSAICLAVPVFLLVYGVMYWGRCPIRPLIPIYLIGSGGMAIVHTLLLIIRTIWVHLKRKRLNSSNINSDVPPEAVSPETTDKAELEVRLPRGFKVIEGLLVIISVVWFFVGNGVTYSLWTWSKENNIPVSDFNTQPLCDPEVFLAAFWFINSIYILAGSSCVCMCFIGCCASVK